METVMFAWFACVGVILILCPLADRDQESSRLRRQLLAQPRLDYLRISAAVLDEWEIQRSNLLIIDLRPVSAERSGSIPGALNIPVARLLQMFSWVPPASRLVFYDQGAVGRFSSAVEQSLLENRIDGVYILDGGIASWHAYRLRHGTSLPVV